VGNEFGLPPKVYDALVANTEAFFKATGNALKEALDPAPKTGPSMMSYPPAYDAATALDNIRHGYGEEGIRGGRVLGDDYLKIKLEALPEILARPELIGIPADMVEFGWLRNLTQFNPNPQFASPFPGAQDNFNGKSLDQYIKEYWAAKAAGTPSGGPKV